MQSMTFHEWSRRFSYGAGEAIRGIRCALTDPRLYSVFSKNAKKLIIISIIILAILNLLFLPIEWLFSLVLPQTWINTSIRAFRYSMNASVPYLLVGICRFLNVKFFESAFFAGLHTKDPTLSNRIQSRTSVHWDWEYTVHLLMFLLRQATMGLAIMLISPFVGVVIPLFRFGYKIRQMERFFWIPVVLAFCFQRTQPLALYIVNDWINARSIIRELYDPIISRLKSSTLSTSEPQEWHAERSEATRLGFAMIIGLLLQIPFIGPFTWFPAFVAAGLCSHQLINLDSFIKRV